MSNDVRVGDRPNKDPINTSLDLLTEEQQAGFTRLNGTFEGNTYFVSALLLLGMWQNQPPSHWVKSWCRFIAWWGWIRDQEPDWVDFVNSNNHG